LRVHTPALSLLWCRGLSVRLCFAVFTVRSFDAVSDAVNGRTKVISTHSLAASQIGPKAQLILDASGAKTTALKRTPVRSVSESARGIWSPLHDKPHEV